MNHIEITTQRLVLKKLDLSFKNEVYKYRSDIEISKYQSFKPKNIEEVENFIRDNTIEFNIEGTWFQLGILYSGQLIGDFGINFFGPDNTQCEIGYTIAKQHQRNGFGFEAVTGVINFLFAKLNKHRLIASVDPENTASIKLLEKVGFRKEAHFKKSVLICDEWIDDIIYGLLNEEWKISSVT
jgi:RimJ/RimL family protein N-acetyltransferase